MKKLFISLLTVILTLQLALTVVFADKLLTLGLGATDADTGGMQYANWHFNQNNLKEVNVVIEINNDPLTEDGLYFQAYDGYINGQMFYFGLQTRTGKPGYGLTGKGLIFSEFGTTDNTNIKTASGGWYEVGTYEGPFISTRIGYDWTNHKYVLTVKYKESDTVGDWYEFWIEDLTMSSKTYVGALRFSFPKDASKKGITDEGGTWTELYYRKVKGSTLPEWSVSIVEVSAVSKDGAIIYPLTAHLKNADNFYHIDQLFHTENNRLDFVIGGDATKSFNEKNITLSSGVIKVNAIFNGNPWNGTLNFTLKRERPNEFISVPLSLSGYPIGTYTIQYVSSGPTNATISSITPSPTQTLGPGSTITFTINFNTRKFEIKEKASIGGSISPSGTVTVSHGESQTFTVNPDVGYKIKDVKVDGESIGGVSTYTFSNVSSDHTIEAIFEPISYIITASAASGGSISPLGTVTVNYGDSKTFTITPNSGYKISNVKVDGASQGPITSYTFSNLTSDHKIEATFEKQITQTVIILQIGNTTFTVNGSPRTLDSPPIIKNGRTLLPIRAVVEALNGTVSWDGTQKKVTVSLGSNTIELWIGKSSALVNGIDTPIDSSNPKVVPEIINGRTMLPLRFVAESLGCSVEWDGTTKTITLTYQGG